MESLAQSRVKFFSESVLPFLWCNYPNMYIFGKGMLKHGLGAFAKALLGPDASKKSRPREVSRTSSKDANGRHCVPCPHKVQPAQFKARLSMAIT